MVSPETKQGLEPRVAERIRSLTPFAKSGDALLQMGTIIECKGMGKKNESQLSTCDRRKNFYPPK